MNNIDCISNMDIGKQRLLISHLDLFSGMR